MDEKLLEILERIASALEKVSNSLNKENNNIPLDTTIKESPSKFAIKDEEKIESDAIKEREHLIEEFLSNHKVTIKHIPPEDEADEILDRISIFIGNRYNLIKPFLNQVKNKLNSGGTIKMDLKNNNQEEIASICQIATMLYEIAFLEEYTYLKSPRYLLFAKPNRIPKAFNFFTGKWLERYVRAQVISLIKQVKPDIKFSYISNPQIELPNGDDFELDILFEIEGEIYWFEAKTWDYQRFVEKYSKISEILNLDKNNTFMILTDITNSAAQALTSLFGMNVINIENFSNEFLNLMIKYLDPKKLEDNNEQNTVA